MTQKKKKSAVSARENAVGLGLLALAVVLIAVLSLLGTNGAGGSAAYETEVTAQSPVRLSEIMSSNASAMIMSDGTMPDWIELENTSDKPVSLNGYALMADGDPTQMHRFAGVTLQPGEFLVLYADNAGGTDHLPFRLSSSGQTLALMNAAGQTVDAVQVPPLEKDQVWCRDGDAWASSFASTPGEANKPNATAAESAFAQAADDSAVTISEVMARNATYAPDENGEYWDYIELTNSSDGPVSLENWFLTDDRTSIARWRFPAVTIEAGGAVMVYCSGYDRIDADGAVHTNFRISGDGADVILTGSNGKTVSAVTVPALETDQAYSLVNGKWTANFAPTPGRVNSAENALAEGEDIRQNNAEGVIISEIAAASSGTTPDWIELYNGGSAAVDLSGWGVSDNAARPRKWQFPAGTVLQPGQYAAVFCDGSDQVSGGKIFTNFSLAAAGGYSVTLSRPDGDIVDRVFVPQQYEDVTYGRANGRDGLYYFTLSTPLAVNDGVAYLGRASVPDYSVEGGLYITGETLTVTLTAQPGAQIFYTLDSSDPTQASALYTGPIAVSSNTILRTRVYADGYIESFTDTQSYLFDVNNGSGVYVISLVSDPVGLISEESGILVKGPNAAAEHPYKGANFWQDWERAAHVEVFGGDGETLLSQNCGIKLHGQYSRAEKQQAFKIIARTEYGENRFPIELFSKRDYTEYQSFVLRSSGQDTDKTRMRDSVLCALAEGTSVLYQETEICILYLDGQYWGQYNIRERINPESICQFEGWEGDEDVVDVVKANTNTMHGSNDTFAELLEAVKQADPTAPDFYANVGRYIDIRNYMEYMAVQIFTGNTDTLNVKRYRNANADGKWRWVLFDLDWAFTTDTNSINRWLTPGGMGNANRTDNTLFIACMKNPQFRDEFLTYMGQQMATTFSTESVVGKIMERYEILEPLLDDQLSRWSTSWDRYNEELEYLINYAKERPMKLLGYFAGTEHLSLTEEQMYHYFGEALEVAKSYGQ